MSKLVILDLCFLKILKILKNYNILQKKVLTTIFFYIFARLKFIRRTQIF